MSSGLCSCVFVAGGRLTTHRMTSSSSPPGRFRRSASVSTTIPSFEGRAGSAGRASGAGKVTLVGFCGAGSGTRRWFFGLASHKGRPQRPHTHTLFHTLTLTHTHRHSHTLARRKQPNGKCPRGQMKKQFRAIMGIRYKKNPSSQECMSNKAVSAKGKAQSVD